MPRATLRARHSIQCREGRHRPACGQQQAKPLEVLQSMAGAFCSHARTASVGLGSVREGDGAKIVQTSTSTSVRASSSCLQLSDSFDKS